jgi:hypothetical protein
VRNTEIHADNESTTWQKCRSIVAAASQAAGRAGSGRGLENRWKKRWISPFSQATRSWLALKIDEYVPLMIPINRARTNIRVDPPPKSTSARSVNITVSDVFRERTTVCARE